MSKDHSHADTNNQSNPIKLAIGIVVGTIALIICLAMLASLAIGAYGLGTTSSDKVAMSPENVAKRIQPVARVVVDESKKAVAAPSAVPAAAVSEPVIVAAVIPAAGVQLAAGGKVDGKTAYEGACAACHTGGIAGAPKFADKAAWSSRISKGSATLYEHAIKGFNTMPAKGGQAALADDAVKAAVDYMVAQAK